MRRWLAPTGLVVLASACAGAGAQSSPAPQPAPPAATATTPASTDTTSVDRPQYVSTYRRRTNPPVLIRNATVLTAAGQEIPNASVLFRDGKIVSVGTNLTAPSDAMVVDGSGKFVTPGIIDTHSHLGVYAAPGTFGGERRQRGHQPGDRRGLGRALDLAAGSADPAGHRRRGDRRCRCCPARPT